MQPEKARAVELGEADGEAAAQALFSQGGTSALAATLVDGAETWQSDAEDADRAAQYKIRHNWQYAYYECFARGARRMAEAMVNGELDGEAGREFGDCLRRMAHVRATIVDAYSSAFVRGATRRELANSQPGAVVGVGVPSIELDARVLGG